MKQAKPQDTRLLLAKALERNEQDEHNAKLFCCYLVVDIILAVERLKDNGKIVRKPWRWRVCRRVTAEEVRENYGDVEGVEDLESCWHVVIHDLQRKQGKVQVATQYFMSNMEILYDHLAEAFDMLDEDDP
eukprot:3839691-Amphidinium_carterae.1